MRNQWTASKGTSRHPRPPLAVRICGAEVRISSGAPLRNARAPPDVTDFARLNPGNYYGPCLTSDGVEP
jgi:hypothetical protein